MLKVKEGADLEKYGFEETHGYWELEVYQEGTFVGTITCWKQEKTISIWSYGNYGVENKLDILYDMIKDGVIEKVGE